MHVWAIDEGIVRLSGSEVPNPSRFFHAPRRLGVRTADQYDQLLPDHDRGEQTLRIGSDLEGNSSRRRSPISIDRKSIVLWREMVTLGEDGTSSMTFTMPRLNGALRFRTVVIHDDLYGATEQSVPVVAPVGIDTTWPRAVAPGDEFRVPLRIHNRTEVAQDITWTFKGGEGLSPAVLGSGDRWGWGDRAAIVTGDRQHLWGATRHFGGGERRIGIDHRLDHHRASRNRPILWIEPSGYRPMNQPRSQWMRSSIPMICGCTWKQVGLPPCHFDHLSSGC